MAVLNLLGDLIIVWEDGRYNLPDVPGATVPQDQVRLTLSLLLDIFAIYHLDHLADIPAWAMEPGSGFVSITRTADELSIVCPERNAPDGVEGEGGWRALKVEGPLAFSLTGVLAAIIQPLAEAAIPIFAISTFETDYVLVKETELDGVVQALEQYGHQVGGKRSEHGALRRRPAELQPVRSRRRRGKVSVQTDVL